MADVLARATVVVEGDIDPDIGRDVSRAFDQVDDAIADAVRALDRVQDAADGARDETGRALGELSDSSQATKDGFGDLSSASSALGAGLASTGLISEGMSSKFSVVADSLGGLEGAFTAVQGVGSLATGVFAQLGPLLGKTAIGQKVLTAATWLQTTAQGALNAVMALNPIALVVIAVVALVAALVIAYKKSETFRNIVNKAFTTVKTVAVNVFNKIKDALTVPFNWAKKNWPLILAILTGPIGLAVLVIKKNFTKITGFFNALQTSAETIATKIGGFFAGIWDALTAGGKAAINGVITYLNLFIKAANLVIKGLNKIPKVNIPTVPEIPKLATGASRFAGGPAIINDRGEETVILPDGSRVLTAQQTKRAEQDQRPIQIVQNNYGATGANRNRELVWALRYGTSARRPIGAN